MKFLASIVILGSIVAFSCAQSVGHYNLTSEFDGKVCILSQFNATILNVTYEKTDNSTANINVMVPAEVNVTGGCGVAGTNESMLILSFKDGHRVLSFDFFETNGTVFFKSSNFSYMLDEEFVDAKMAGQTVMIAGQVWNQPISNATGSFECNSTFYYELISGETHIRLEMTRLQAFNVMNDSYSEQVERCPQDEPTTPMATTEMANTTMAMTTEAMTTEAMTTEATTMMTTTPKPVVGHYDLKDMNGTFCIMSQFNATLMVNYTKHDNETALVDIMVPLMAEVSGMCPMNMSSQMMSQLKLSFKNGTRTLTADFEEVNGTAVLTGISFFFVYDEEFVNASMMGQNETIGNSTLNLALSKATDAYRCDSGDMVMITSRLDLMTVDFIVQAFNVMNDTYGPENRCAGDMTTQAPQTTETTHMMNHTTEMTTTTTTMTTTTTTMMPTTTTDTPTDNHFKINGSDGVVCLVADMGVRFSINYLNTDDKNMTALIDLPSVNQTAGGVTGMCENDTNSLTIDFLKTWQLRLFFGKDSGSFALENVTLVYDMDDPIFEKPKTKGVHNTTGTNLGLLKGTIGNSFLCKKNVDAMLDTATMTFTYVQVQAFSTEKTDTFADADDCDTETSEIVPIVVGCALGALVLIVLIAYLIGRKRAKRGYQSV